MKMVGNRSQENTGPKIAAYQPTALQSADEELSRAVASMRQDEAVASS